jgi:hypothetical protein
MIPPQPSSWPSAVRVINVDAGTLRHVFPSHSVDHTGDGRNEEAESPFTLSQPLYMLFRLRNHPRPDMLPIPR